MVDYSQSQLGIRGRPLGAGRDASVPPEALLRGMASGYVNCLGELAAIAPSVAEKAAMELTRRSDAGLEPYIGDEHAGPEPDGEIFEVDGKPFAMPARVLDASQGWAMFFVDTEAANLSLGGRPRNPVGVRCRRRADAAHDCRSGLSQQRFWRLSGVRCRVDGDREGRSRTAVVHLLLGDCRHAGVHQRGRPHRMGARKDRLPQACGPLRLGNVLFGVQNTKGKALSIRFPRFGDARSSDLPTFSISRRGAGPERRTYWAMTTKSGSGEGTQIGGSVILELGVPGDGWCLCADGKSVCVCEMLRGFDIADRLPAANGWTERQTAVYGPPRLLDFPR